MSDSAQAPAAAPESSETKESPVDDIQEVMLSYGDETESMLLCKGIPVEDITESIGSMFPSLPGKVMGLREVDSDGVTLGPFIPLHVLASDDGMALVAGGSEFRVQATPAWRREGITYTKNEVHVDVIEQVNLSMSIQDLGNGNSRMSILSSFVSGAIRLRCQLSGMPAIKLSFEAKDFVERTFHPCVKLDKYDPSTLKLIPPDGETELMRYRVNKFIKLPFRLLPVMKRTGKNTVEVKINMKANFSKKLTGNDVSIKVPCPKNTLACIATTSKGKAEYIPELSAVVWRVPKFPGDEEHSLSAEIQLAEADDAGTELPPISMDFQVVSFAASGFHVRYLEVFENSNYRRDTWVRYITTAGQYETQLSLPPDAA